MKYRQTNILEDKNIDQQIREYGVRRLARDLEISPAYISRALNGLVIMSEEVYRDIVKVLTNVKTL